MKIRFLAVVTASLLFAASASFASAGEMTAAKPAPLPADSGLTLAGGKHHGHHGGHHRGHRGLRFYGPFFSFGPGYYADDYSYYGTPYNCYRRCRLYHGPRYCRSRCGY